MAALALTGATTSQQRTDALIGWLRDYAGKYINSRLIDERRTIPPYIVLDFGNQGILGIQMDPALGGAGLNHVDTMRFTEQLGAIDPTLRVFYALHNMLGIRPIYQSGTEAVKAELIPRLASGRLLAGFALTEPEAGSNPRAMQASATPAGQDRWLLHGTKIWIGSASWASTLNVFARHPESGQISGFIVRRETPGLRMGPEALTMGMRGVVQNKLYLEGVPVGTADLLGGVGNGMAVAQDAMSYARLILAAGCIGGMKRSAQLMLRYAARRTVATGNLLDNPVTRAKFSEMIAATTAIRTFVMQLARLLDAGWTIPAEISAVSKVTAAEFGWRATDTLMQTLGGRGYIEPNIAPQLLRDMRLIRVFEGPNETLTMFIGATLVNGGGEFYRFLSLGLDAPHIADRILTAVEEIQLEHQGVSQQAQLTLAEQQWLYTQVGEVAMYGTLVAALEGVLAPTTVTAQAVVWAEQHYERALSIALATPLHAAHLLDRTTISELVTDYTATIGDIEQTLADEDRELDPLLRRDWR